MAATLANALQGAGIAKAGAHQFSVDREAERATARATKEAKDQELEMMKATKLSESDYKTIAETNSAELQTALMQQQQMIRQGNKLRTFDAFDRYSNGDQDIRHMNQALQELAKNGSKLFGDISRMDKVTADDEQRLKAQGFGSAQINNILNDPDTNASYVRTTSKDGMTQEIRNLDELKGMTGYNDYADEKELKRQTTQKEVQLLQSLGYSGEELSREAFRRAAEDVRPDVKRDSPEFQEAYTKHYDALKAQDWRSGRSGGKGNRGENLTEKEAEAKRRANMDGLYEGQSGYDQSFSKHMSDINTEWGRPSSMRNLEDSENAQASLDEMDFFNMEDTMDLATRAKVEPLINRIEKGSGVELSTADKVTLERINELTHLGSEASQMTDKQVGIIDRVFRGVSKYISDNTEGVAQEAAYAGYRNVVRKSLYGSVLTPGETKAFTEQFGKLTHQRGPILAQLATSMEQLRSNYETLVATNNPYVIKHRTGQTATELYDAIDALEQNIEMINTVRYGGKVADPSINKPSQATTQSEGVVLTPEVRSGLDNIYKGTGQAGVSNED